MVMLFGTKFFRCYSTDLRKLARRLQDNGRRRWHCNDWARCVKLGATVHFNVTPNRAGVSLIFRLLEILDSLVVRLLSVCMIMGQRVCFHEKSKI